ncbi:NlpC/P60 family peptidoglycan-binding protein RipD [Mycobacterium sp. CBMA293]|uniref:NlpC/P60 family peptidoglycan-binding protein RipD n=1 Tax=unclassified Mycolicibacterium TaxID=2636767 RepID=UPI0012DE2DC4|nr:MULTISPECIES: NlpC/P60 family peptidoglycan-binding protein RipD [unclassified Mycolicibacterium]MUL48956.1 NlpC/P60 family peptidoglycan-binding protein RipD [Mycolicibacterium sp. CBMA 360]MUL58630.1 NlpC/P60 family peptidoglycan-binding protein RipD [Mycolicibacterium sp. CBMA 335]MUL74088.1 NlpC/P60 family peptidoglycan-binding protein RipD [Mycolicibacterium sp. CBMA 311]MUL93513.1 NlpC/P60 family peptidoglycan-binding protein RipD [Mycolicibacterium sp. CBMA 230]MUM04731.1 hydrolase [
MRRMFVMVVSAALLMVTPLAATPSASADSATWTGGTHRQAIEFVIQRALAQRGVPFTYGGGNANGPSLPPANVSAAAAPAGQPAPQVGLQQPLGIAQPAAAAPQTSGIIPGLAGLFGPSPATANPVAPVPTTPGFDSSGLVQYAFSGVGIKLPRSSGEQYKVGRKLTADQALPGDLIFYGPAGSQSVALFVGNGQMVEGTEPTVTVSPVRTGGMDPYLSRIIEWQ